MTRPPKKERLDDQHNPSHPVASAPGRAVVDALLRSLRGVSLEDRPGWARDPADVHEFTASLIHVLMMTGKMTPAAYERCWDGSECRLPVRVRTEGAQ